jgi:hypothetical protein
MALVMIGTGLGQSVNRRTDRRFFPSPTNVLTLFLSSLTYCALVSLSLRSAFLSGGTLVLWDLPTRSEGQALRASVSCFSFRSCQSVSSQFATRWTGSCRPAFPHTH